MAINEEATFKYKGYRSTDLSYGSQKKVWAVCDECGKGRWVLFQKYCDLCLHCSRSTEEYRKKISDLHRGKTISEEQRKKISKANKGKKHTEAARKKISDGQKGEKNHMYGKHHTENARKKISDAEKGENHHNYKPGVKLVCKQCGGEYEVKPYMEDKSRFCSRECTDKWRSENCRGENSTGWKGGISFEPYCHKFNEAFKESIREKFGRVCFLCPTTEEENGKKLSVHHVSYNKDCLCDDSECEFVPLCNKCHTKTNFNRDYWENLIMGILHGTNKIF